MRRKQGLSRVYAIAAALVVLASSQLLAGPALADPPPGSAALVVSPPTTEVDATPGQQITQKVGIDNVSEDTRSLNVGVQNFAANGEEGEAALTEDDNNNPYSLSQWIKVSPSSATLAPHGHQDFQVQITVPHNAPPGGHFGAIVFSPVVTPGGGGASLAIQAQVTSLVLLRVPGNATEKASVAGLNICKPAQKKTTCDKSSSFFQGGPITFTPRIQNQGNVQLQPEGTLTIYNMFGSKVATLPVPVKGASNRVLPDSIRRFDVPWKHGTLFGMYKARLELRYGSNPQTLKVDKSFYGFPLAMAGTVLAVLLVVFLMFWLPRKRLKKAFKALASSSE